MKKLLALLLVLVMVMSVSLTGCHEEKDSDADSVVDEKQDDNTEASTESKKDENKDDQTEDNKTDNVADKDNATAEPSLTRKWEGDVDMAPLLNQGFAEDEAAANYLKVSSFTVCLILDFEDDGTYSIRIDEESFEEAVDYIVPELADGFAKMVRDQGQTVEDYEAQLGMTLETYVEQMFAGMDHKDFESDGTYLLDGNKLYTDEEEDYTEIQLSANELIMLSYSGEKDETFEVLLKGTKFKPAKSKFEGLQTDNERLIGIWQGKIDIADSLNLLFEQMFGPYNATYFTVDTFPVGITMTFEEDGDYSMALCESDIEAGEAELLPKWVTGMKMLLIGQGITVKQFEQQTGMSLETYVGQAFSVSPSDLETDGEYALIGKKLHLGSPNKHFVIRLVDDLFEIVSYSENTDGRFEMLLKNAVFTRSST